MSFSPDEVDRYARQIVLRELGGPGQQRLKAATVALIGAGGLGAPAALYLAAAGVGTLRLIDPDTVALSNLQRQVIFSMDDLGRDKTAAAADALAALNPNVVLQPRPVALTGDNAADLLAGCDLVLDGTDDFETRFCVNAACRSLDIPLISGAIGRWTGQVGLFPGRPCYRCLVPETPPEAETCSVVGVVGALGGVIGSMMALEAIKVIAGAGEPLSGRLMIYDALSATTRTVRVAADPACPVCGEGPWRAGFMEKPARKLKD